MSSETIGSLGISQEGLVNDSPDEMIRIQERLAGRVDLMTTLSKQPELICGMDAAYAGNSGVGVAIVVNGNGSVVESVSSRIDGLVDYRPGLFGFREGPLLVAAAFRLESKPDVFIVEGHGLAHPRRCGLGCHVGLALEKPTIGVARNPLYGMVKDSHILDADGTVLGRILRVGRRRLYVSVGHKINIDSAVRAVELSLQRSDYPLPLKMAHQESVLLRNRYYPG